MKINSVRAYEIILDHEEAVRYHHLGPNKDQVWVDNIRVGMGPNGDVRIRMSGTYKDPMDLNEKGKPKVKKFSTTMNMSDLSMDADDPVMQFLSKLNVVKSFEMSMPQFMREEDPVG